MKNGFVKVGCATPAVRVADVKRNAEEIIALTERAARENVRILVFPELCLTGYTAGDLFYSDVLQSSVRTAIGEIRAASVGKNMLIFIGAPLREGGKIFNTAVAVFEGRLLGIVPKTFLPNYNEFYEKRQFCAAEAGVRNVRLCDESVPFGTNLIFKCSKLKELTVAAELCEDLWVMSPPSAAHAAAGANIIVNLSASNELIGKSEYRRTLVSGQSARLICGYIYADAGKGESTTDMVFAGHNLIAENGRLLKESTLFAEGLITSEIDVAFLTAERSKFASYVGYNANYTEITFDMKAEETALTRSFPRFPFVPSADGELERRSELILSLQANALAKRLAHVNAKCAVIGISGGLDSALALLAAVRAKELLPEERRKTFDVLGITMPCFGTTDRTLRNAKKLTRQLGATCIKISVRTAVNRHLLDIKQEKGKYDVTYENAQARERTQVLMDVANSKGGIVVGTGDLSEVALGWSTYNGDHMSMYGVNSSVPKTLVKHLVQYEADRYGGKIKTVLCDILDTPISPELLPTDGKTIVQKTEDKIGQYMLHDFFLYYFVRCGYAPDKILRVAKIAFSEYGEEELRKWLTVFVKRFFSQQFKRSCIPDGVKIGSVSLSPRADWRMPSDAIAAVWLADLEGK